MTYGAVRLSPIVAPSIAPYRALEEALQNSDSPNNLKLKINLSEGIGSATAKSAGGEAKSDALGGLALLEIQKDDEEEVTE